MSKARKSSKLKEITGEIRFHYIKSNHFRVTHVDGAIVGVAPNGKHLRLIAYNERSAIPQETKVVLEGGKIKSEEVTVSKGGVVREMEFEIVVDLDQALSIGNLMGEKATEAMEFQKGLEKSGDR